MAEERRERILLRRTKSSSTSEGSTNCPHVSLSSTDALIPNGNGCFDERLDLLVESHKVDKEEVVELADAAALDASPFSESFELA